MGKCKYATALEGLPAETRNRVGGLTSRPASQLLGIGKSSINDHRATPRTCACASTTVPTSKQSPAGESETHNPDGTSSYTRFSDTPWGFDQYREFIRSTGQDPDKVTFTWGWTSNPGGGCWNKLNNVRPIPDTVAADNAIDYKMAQASLRAYKLPRRIPGTGLGAPVASVLNLADMQLHKPDGDGLTGTLQRLTDGLENFQAYVSRQRAGGRNIDELVMVNNGDPFEGIAGNYANQLKTVGAGLREQMNTVLDVWTTYSRELFPQYDKGQFVTVHCNHTQFGRQGGAKDSLTGDSDTGSAFLAEALQRILTGRPDFDHVKFTIPNDEMNVYTTAAGVPMGFNHGHKIPGAGADGFEKWLNGQVRGDALAYAVRVWITAHKHSFQSFDLGSTFVAQCPSCDGGSKWLRDTTGRYSTSGILALLVGNHVSTGWSDPALL